MNIFRQIRHAEPSFEPACIFDIGANIGQTVRQIRIAYPAAPVHAFEPVSSTFATLEAAVAGDRAVTTHRLAFGARSGRVTMQARPGSVVNRIVHGRLPPGPTEEVEVVAGDIFCARHGIQDIGILKVDTEGHDLEVLAGFRDMLGARRIRYVEAECALSANNTMHVPFQRIADFMGAFGYGLFGVFAGNPHPDGYYNLQTGKRQRGIWYGNAVFIAEPWPEEAANPSSAPAA